MAKILQPTIPDKPIGKKDIERVINQLLVKGKINGNKIAPQTVGTTVIKNYTITTDKVKNNTITTEKIVEKAVTPDKLNVSELSAITGNVGNLTSGTFTLDATGFLKSSNYVAGKSGFYIDKDFGEFDNIRARGKITTSVFEKDTISANAADAMDTNSDILDEDMTEMDDSTLKITGDISFSLNEILHIKDGVDEEYMRVTDISSAPTYTVTRDLAGAYESDANPAWKKGICVAGQGISNGVDTYSGGWLFRKGAGTNSPYYAVVKRTGIAADAFTEYARLGNLRNFLDYPDADEYGLAVGELTKYLKYDPTNGLRIKGKITADQLDLAETSITVYPGDDVQAAVNSLTTGGRIYFTAGTYTFTDDLVIPSNVVLEGCVFLTVYLVFIGNYGIKIIGTDAYSAGTIDATPGSTTITGHGTQWLANVTDGHTMCLGSLSPFTIASVDSDTQITLDTPYAGKPLASENYWVAITKDNVILKNLVIMGSDGIGIEARYTTILYAEKVYVYTCGTNGWDLRHCSVPELQLAFAAFNGGYGFYIEDCDYASFYLGAVSNTLSGINIVDTNNAIFPTGVIMNNGGDGITMNACHYNAFYGSVEFSYNTGEGIYLNFSHYNIFSAMVFGNGGVGFLLVDSDGNIFDTSQCSDNQSDGMRLESSSHNHIADCIISGNNGWGINIIDADSYHNEYSLGNNIAGNLYGEGAESDSIKDLGSNIEII